MERIISVFLLSVLCKTSEPLRCGAKASRTRLVARSSRNVELLPISSNDQLPTATFPPTWAVKPPQPDSLASENDSTSGTGGVAAGRSKNTLRSVKVGNLISHVTSTPRTLAPRPPDVCEKNVFRFFSCLSQRKTTLRTYIKILGTGSPNTVM